MDAASPPGSERARQEYERAVLTEATLRIVFAIEPLVGTTPRGAPFFIAQGPLDGPVRLDQQAGTGLPMLVHLTPQIVTIDVAGERAAEHFRQPRHRGQDHGRVAMKKNESRIGIDLADRLQGEKVVRTF